MCQLEFVEVMDMGYAEVERRHEDNLGGLNFGQNMDWDNDRAEEDFFRDWTGDIVAVALPTAQALSQTMSALKLLLDEDDLEQWSEIQQDDEDAASYKFDRLDGPPAQ